MASTSSERSRQEKKRPSRPLPGLLRWGRGRRMVAAAVTTVAALFAGLLFGLFGHGRGSGAALTVDAAAGLHAAAAQAAFAAHVAGPVTAARHAVAQRAVDEAFQIQPFGTGPRPMARISSMESSARAG